MHIDITKDAEANGNEEARSTKFAGAPETTYFISKPNFSKMKIAIIGEGPIGSFLVCALLLKMPKESSVTLMWYHKYRAYTRRQIVRVSQSIVNRISNELFRCEECFNTGKMFNSSIRRLEYIVSDMIKDRATCYKENASDCFLKVKYEAFDQDDYSKYDHVFLANGSECPQRQFLMHDNTKYKPLTCTPRSPELVLYSNLGEVEITNDNRAGILEKDQNSSEKILDESVFSNYDLEINETVGIINIVYKTRRSGERFTQTAKEKGLSVSLDQLNLRYSGFENYKHFFYIFTQT